MYKRILVANDGSESGFKAFAAALELAGSSGAELAMICVGELPYVPASIDEVVEQEEEEKRRHAPAIERARKLAAEKGVALAIHELEGHPVKRVVEFVDSNGVDLLVVGFHGHSAAYERLIGGTADRLVRLAHCAVLVVK